MQKMSQTEEMAKMLAGRARRHVLTPEQVSRAMEEQDFDPAGLDELYAALEMRGVQVAEEEQNLWDEYSQLLPWFAHFAMRKVSDPSEIYPVSRDLFKKEGAQV